MHRTMSPLRLPLIRLLAVNLAIGVTIAALTLGGILALNPRLLALIAHDAVAFGLLLFGFVVTLGGVAKATAVWALGAKPREAEDDRGGGTLAPVIARRR